MRGARQCALHHQLRRAKEHAARAAVGREGPGRAEQRHVVVLLGVVDAEADRHVPQEGLGRRRHALRREVLSDMKGPLVGARAEVRTFKGGAVEAAVFIGSEGVGRREIAMIT